MTEVVTAQQVAEPNTIVRAVVGSTVHGTAVEGTDDRDEMGVCLEPPEYVVGLSHFEQWVHRDRPAGVRSEPGDLDLTVYSARKYVRLLLGGNPTILLLLFVPREHTVSENLLGAALRIQGPQWLGKNALTAFLGYMTSQRQRLTGERGGKDVNRPELVERYGFDTKYAGHMIRLGLQGLELARTGRITLPMPPAARQHVRDIREGRVPLSNVLQFGGELERELADLQDTSSLRDAPDKAAANRWLYDAYELHWQVQGWRPRIWPPPKEKKA